MVRQGKTRHAAAGRYARCDHIPIPRDRAAASSPAETHHRANDKDFPELL